MTPFNYKRGRSEGSFMATGRVKWFNNSKGYGFVRPDHGGEDLFVHYSYITMEGYKTLKAGQPVNFDVKEAGKGHHAINLTLLDESVPGTEALPSSAAYSQSA